MKSLYKVGYSLLPEAERVNYKTLHSIITTNDYDTKLKDYCTLLHATFPTPMQSPFIITYKKREQHTTLNVPTKMIAIYFGRFMYQFVLLNDQDSFMYRIGEKGIIKKRTAAL